MTEGPITTVATWLVVLPSSQVSSRSDLCVVQAGELKIAGRLFANHVSPTEMAQSCMSLQRSGVIQAKLGVVLVEARSAAKFGYGTTWFEQRCASFRMSLK